MDSKSSHIELSKIIDFTRNCELFVKIFEEQGNDKIHIACCKLMRFETFESGRVIIKYGEPAKDFFVILEGRVSVRIPITRSKNISNSSEPLDTNKNLTKDWNFKNKAIGSAIVNKLLGFDCHEEVKILNPGDTFGELALISDRPRAATVTAKTKVVMGVLSKDIFQHLLKKYSEKSLFEKIDFLQSLPLFKSRTRIHLMKISYYFSLKKFTWNQLIYKEGDTLSNIYIIKSGDIMLTQSMNQDRKKSINKHYRNISQQINLNLLKKGKGMILGLDEALSSEPTMRQSARCVSACSEVYIITKHVPSIQDFDTRIYRQDLAISIKNSYNISQELIKSCYLKSCLTERAKSSLDHISLKQSDPISNPAPKPSKIFMRTRREQPQKKPENSNEKLSKLLYNNKRTTYSELHTKSNSASRIPTIFKTHQPSPPQIQVSLDQFFKTSVPDNLQ